MQFLVNYKNYVLLALCALLFPVIVGAAYSSQHDAKSLVEESGKSGSVYVVANSKIADITSNPTIEVEKLTGGIAICALIGPESATIGHQASLLSLENRLLDTASGDRANQVNIAKLADGQKLTDDVYVPLESFTNYHDGNRSIVNSNLRRQIQKNLHTDLDVTLGTIETEKDFSNQVSFLRLNENVENRVLTARQLRFRISKSPVARCTEYAFAPDAVKVNFKFLVLNSTIAPSYFTVLQQGAAR